MPHTLTRALAMTRRQLVEELKSAPTYTAIEQRRAALADTSVAALGAEQDALEFASTLWTLAGLAAVMMMLWPEFAPSVRMALVGCAGLALSAALFLALQAERRFRVCDRARQERLRLSVVPHAVQPELNALCQASAAARAYRQQVLDQGRAFVLAELFLLRAHAAELNYTSTAQAPFEVQEPM